MVAASSYWHKCNTLFKIQPLDLDSRYSSSLSEILWSFTAFFSVFIIVVESQVLLLHTVRKSQENVSFTIDSPEVSEVSIQSSFRTVMRSYCIPNLPLFYVSMKARFS